MVCVFVIAMTSLLVVRILDTETAQLAAIRNTTDYERALYLAGAGVHHALAELESDNGWRGTVTAGSYPADGSYTATAVDGVGAEVVVTGIGVAGDAVRTLEATVSLGG
jgi:hypothetical protein